jgi:hypothetical protein
MASVILAGTTTGTSLSLTGDTSGVLVLQTNNGTTALTLGTNQVATFAAAVSTTALTSTGDATISGLRVGKGAGSDSLSTALGTLAINANTTGTQNTGVGWASLFSNTTGSSNSGFGYATLFSNTTGGFNTAVGNGALNGNTTASGNTAVGYQSLYSNQTGVNNTAVGYQAGYAAVVNRGTFIGYLAGTATTGGNNTFVGDNSGPANTTGASNVALGSQSLFSNTTASNNTAVGYQAGYTNTTGAFQTFIGLQAGYYCTTGTWNTAVGASAGNALTTGSYNTFIGCLNSAGNGSGSAITTGSKNSILGGYTGNDGGLDIRTLSNYIVLSDGDANPRLIVDNNGDLLLGTTTNGYAAKQLNAFNGTSRNGIVLNETANSSNTVYVAMLNALSEIGSIRRVGSTSAVVYNTTSDQRLKSNIADANPVLDKLMDVKVRQFDWTEGDLHQEAGFIAQELAPVLSGIVTQGKKEEDMWQMDYSRLTPYLVKAIQELNAKVEAQALEIATLKGK